MNLLSGWSQGLQCSKWSLIGNIPQKRQSVTNPPKLPYLAAERNELSNDRIRMLFLAFLWYTELILTVQIFCLKKLHKSFPVNWSISSVQDCKDHFRTWTIAVQRHHEGWKLVVAFTNKEMIVYLDITSSYVQIAELTRSLALAVLTIVKFLVHRGGTIVTKVLLTPSKTEHCKWHDGD